MGIITISRGSYSQGKEIAESVARRLGYECISRELLLEASDHFNIPEVKLFTALHDAPSILDRFHYGKERYLTFIQRTFLEHARHDNIVYHGLAGHVMLPGVGHCLAVRLVVNMEDRVRLKMDRENVSEEEALRTLQEDDEGRRKWSLALWGKDPLALSLYDIMIHVRRLGVEDAAGLICRVAGYAGFRTTPESQKAVDDLFLAAQVRSQLVLEVPSCEVTADAGLINVRVIAELTQEPEMTNEVKRLVQGVQGVKEIRVHVMPPGV